MYQMLIDVVGPYACPSTSYRLIMIHQNLLIIFVTFIIHPQNSSDNMNIDRVTYDGIH